MTLAVGWVSIWVPVDNWHLACEWLKERDCPYWDGEDTTKAVYRCFHIGKSESTTEVRFVLNNADLAILFKLTWSGK